MAFTVHRLLQVCSSLAGVLVLGAACDPAVLGSVPGAGGTAGAGGAGAAGAGGSGTVVDAGTHDGAAMDAGGMGSGGGAADAGPSDAGTPDGAADVTVPPGAAARALVMVDQRLFEHLRTELERYVALAQLRRRFPIELRARERFDDWAPTEIAEYLSAERERNPELQGVLFVGNIRLATFYKPSPEEPTVRYLPRFYEDLDARYWREYGEGAFDPPCAGPPQPTCVVGELPLPVPPHDFDATAPGVHPGPELWAAFMPVGDASGADDHASFAEQLRPYLSKLEHYYGQPSGPHRGYFRAGGMLGDSFESVWRSWPREHLHVHGRPPPGCAPEEPVNCFERWPAEEYASDEAFSAAYMSSPYSDGSDYPVSVFHDYFEAAAVEVMEIEVPGWSSACLTTAADARTLTGGPLLFACGGDASGSFRRLHDTSVSLTEPPADNVLISLLYGPSDVVAALGNTTKRYHSGQTPSIYRSMKTGGTYLGRAHYERNQALYGTLPNPDQLRALGNEILLGDPFLDFGE